MKPIGWLYFLHLSNPDIGARAVTLASNWFLFQCSKINKYKDHFFQCSLCHIINLFFVSVHKNAKRELGQYPAILTSRLVNNIYLLLPLFLLFRWQNSVSKDSGSVCWDLIPLVRIPPISPAITSRYKNSGKTKSSRRETAVLGLEVNNCRPYKEECKNKLRIWQLPRFLASTKLFPFDQVS